MLAPLSALLSSRAGACLALAIFVLAGRAWLAEAWGSSVPLLDQWGGETELYRNYISDTLTWPMLVAPHNEHRILLTRLASLGLFAVGGGWNPWAQLLLNAGLHAAIAAGLALLFWPALAARTRALFLAGLALLFTATAGWQNALWGFQSQVYFTSLLALGGIAAIAPAAPGDRRIWLGSVLLLLALFASAGGLLAGLAALLLALLRPRDRYGLLALVLLGGVVALGLALHVSPPQHEPLHARSVSRFLAVSAHSLSWPHVDSNWLWLGMQAPFVALLFRRMRNRTPLSALERVALGLAVFAGLNAAAIAYSRGGGLPELRPLSRYQDPLLLGAAGQLFAALTLAVETGRPGRLFAVGWGAFMVVGLLTLTTTQLTLNLPYKRAQDAASLAQIRTYLITHDASVFTADPLYPGPHPDPKVLQHVLDDPVLRPVLPPAFFSPASEAASDPKPWVIAEGRTLFFVSLAMLIGVLTALATQKPGEKRTTTDPAGP